MAETFDLEFLTVYFFVFGQIHETRKMVGDGTVFLLAEKCSSHLMAKETVGVGASV